MIPILVLKTENKVIYNKSNLNCKTFFEEFIYFFLLQSIHVLKRLLFTLITTLSFVQVPVSHSTCRFLIFARAPPVQLSTCIFIGDIE